MKKKRGSSVRRQTFLKDLPRRAAIPKFLLPDEIQKVKTLKALDPKMNWDEAVQHVVFNSVKDIPSIVGVKT
jgi:hypothetical protein